MRIALFVETYLPYINGVVTHVNVLKEGLERQGHTVLVVTADPKVKHHIIKDGVLHCPAVTVKKLYSYGIAAPYNRRRMKLISEFNPDIIHIHQEFGVGVSGLYAAKTLKVPVVYTMHTMYDEYLYYVANEKFMPIVKRLSQGYFKKIAKRSDCITGPSKKVSEYIDKLGIKKQVNVIPNSVELDKFNLDKVSLDDRREVREELGINENDFVALFVGRLGKEKSVDILIDYWKEELENNKDIKLLIIGDGPSKEELMKQAKELNIEDQILFTGKVVHDDLPRYISACDIYATASTSDTNSISMKEAMAMGLPVLQILDRLNEDQVVNGVNGYVFENAKELAKYIKEVKNMTSEQLDELRKRVSHSVVNADCDSLAKYVEALYYEVYNGSENHSNNEAI